MSFDISKIRLFRQRLLAWYAKNARVLPWRGTTDPYRVWVSEVMLQQTTTKTVEGYFDRFITRFPTIADLADTNLDEINRLWEGLGYYRRAAQLHRGAREIVERFDGVFPNRLEDVQKISGIGRYTAGAILSIAFGQRQPILEANTVRLHARLLALKADPTTREANDRLWFFAEEILPTKNAGHFNQALMDLGSMVCTPKTPACDRCPVFEFCETAKLGLQEIIPYQKRKEQKEARTEVAVSVRKGKKFLLIRYPDGVRWAGLWDFPRSFSLSDSQEKILRDSELIQRLQTMTGRRLELSSIVSTIKHAVTRFSITLYLVEGKDKGFFLSQDNSIPFEVRWVSLNDIADIPLNSTARKMVSLLIDSRES